MLKYIVIGSAVLVLLIGAGMGIAGAFKDGQAGLGLYVENKTPLNEAKAYEIEQQANGAAERTTIENQHLQNQYGFEESVQAQNQGTYVAANNQEIQSNSQVVTSGNEATISRNRTMQTVWTFAGKWAWIPLTALFAGIAYAFVSTAQAYSMFAKWGAVLGRISQFIQKMTKSQATETEEGTIIDPAPVQFFLEDGAHQPGFVPKLAPGAVLKIGDQLEVPAQIAASQASAVSQATMHLSKGANSRRLSTSVDETMTNAAALIQAAMSRANESVPRLEDTTKK